MDFLAALFLLSPFADPESSDILGLTSTVPRFMDILVALDLLFSSVPGVPMDVWNSSVARGSN